MTKPSHLALPDKIITALYREDYKTLERFLNKNTVNLRDEDFGRTLLMLAVSAGDPILKMVKFLIDKGADVNLSESGGEQYTALHFAAFDLRKDVVHALLEAGADANAPDRSGNTPLHKVVWAYEPKAFLADLLLRHGADPNRKGGGDASPKEVAEQTGQGDLFQGVKPPRRRQKPQGKRKPGRT